MTLVIDLDKCPEETVTGKAVGGAVAAFFGGESRETEDAGVADAVVDSFGEAGVALGFADKDEVDVAGFVSDVAMKVGAAGDLNADGVVYAAGVGGHGDGGRLGGKRWGNAEIGLGVEFNEGGWDWGAPLDLLVEVNPAIAVIEVGSKCPQLCICVSMDLRKPIYHRNCLQQRLIDRHPTRRLGMSNYNLIQEDPAAQMRVCN